MLTPRSLFRFVPVVLLATLVSSCDQEPEDPDDDTAAWSQLPRIYQRAEQGSVHANNGKVYLGFLDGDTEQPYVKTFDEANNEWVDYGTGLTALYNGIAHDQPINPSFRFKQEGDNSYIFYNRSITESELIVLTSNGGAWQQLPSVPLNLLPGGFFGIIQDGFDFEVKNGNMYVAVRGDSDGEAYLCTFMYSGGGWVLLPSYPSYPRVPNTFSYEGYFHEPFIRVTDNGTIYVSSIVSFYGTGLAIIHLYRYDGGAWTEILSQLQLEGYTSSGPMRFFAATFGGQDRLLAVPFTTDYSNHILSYNGSGWTEVAATDPGIDFVYTDCGDCWAMFTANGLDGAYVTLYNNGTWNKLANPSYWLNGGLGIYYNEDIAYDASNTMIYVANSGTDNDYHNYVTVSKRDIGQ